VNDVRKGEHHLESEFEHVANWAERELPSINIRQELLIGQHDVENGVKGAVRSVKSDLPGLDVRRDIRCGERALQNCLRRLDPENIVRDVHRSEHEVHADFKDAERAVVQMMPVIHVGRDLRRSERDWVQEGERELKYGLKGAERMVEGVLLDLHFGRDVQKGGHELRIGENNLFQSSKKMKMSSALVSRVQRASSKDYCQMFILAAISEKASMSLKGIYRTWEASIWSETS